MFAKLRLLWGLGCREPVSSEVLRALMSSGEVVLVRVSAGLGGILKFRASLPFPALAPDELLLQTSQRAFGLLK